MAHREKPTAEHVANVLRGAGLRVTAQRVAVYTALATHPHASVDAIHGAIRDAVPGIALPTVHGVVGDLTDAGIVRRVSLPDADRALYELEYVDNHHHLQCIVCGRVEDVECTVGHAPCLIPSQDHGMRVLEATVTFRAICSDCERNGHG
ncbi:Fur family transcriptional regulator [Microbacterium nymphoidis]|uniref:Fur family transcriptional regulator n=1 Tax=Microbacterium nymphoidis TaxID=2898586 RepID=UPI001E4A7C88|nr:Fur family transcriptional regulator [Microbacterium nymphoidis]MCD2499762.1 transcriptional repressor [Microbacterium nymphoidis]